MTMTCIICSIKGTESGGNLCTENNKTLENFQHQEQEIPGTDNHDGVKIMKTVK